MSRTRNRFVTLAVLVIAALIILVGCGEETGGAGDSDGTVNVVTTTGMIADVVRNVGGDRVEVEALMGPGVDPHLYRASAGDVDTLDRAEIIFYTGLDLEGRMEEIFERLKRSKPTIPVTEGVDEARLLESPTYQGQFDPHIWFDVSLWKETIAVIERELIEIDPDGADTFRQNAESFAAELTELDTWVEEQIATIPEPSRVLITAHDAFGYFGARYGVDVRGLQGTSTATEAGAADVQNLADFIAERQIAAIFVESSVPRETIEAVEQAVESRGWDVEIGGQLFSDAMGEEGTPEGTYIGMVRYNITTIVTALNGQVSE